MKKLLGILGSISMVASLTTLVVACGEDQTKKTDLGILKNVELGVFDKEPETKDILDRFNEKNGSVIGELSSSEVTIKIKPTSATITANDQSTKYSGWIRTTFAIQIDLSSYTETVLKAFNSKPTDQQIIDDFNLKNWEKPTLVLGTDVIIESNLRSEKDPLITTSAIIKAAENSPKYKGQVGITFDIKINLNSFTTSTLTGFKITPKDTDILKEFNEANKIDLQLNTDITIENITNIGAIIKANPDSKLYTGSKKVNFKSVIQTTKYRVEGNDKVHESYDPDLSSLKKVTKIEQFGYYKSAKNVIEIAKLPTTITEVPKELPKEVTSLKLLFHKNETFDQDLSGWDVSKITDMSYMFLDAEGFTNKGQALNWGQKTLNVTNMNSMFRNAWNFNQDITSWDVSNVTDMGHMFAGATAFNQKINTKKIVGEDGKPEKPSYTAWNTSNVTNMSYMFTQANKFNQDISSWNVSKVIDMTGMFWDAETFNQNLSYWIINDRVKHDLFADGSGFEKATDWHPKWG